MKTKKVNFLTLLCILTIACSGSAYAAARGTNSGGGGDAILEGSSNVRLLDLAEMSNLEYLNPVEILSNFKSLSYKISTERILVKYSKKAFHNHINEDLFSFYIQKSLSVPGKFDFSEDEFVKKPIEMEFYFSDSPLPEIDDEGKIYIGVEYEKIQLAIQNPKGQVAIYKPLFNKLSTKDKSALLLHEALLRLVWQYNPDHLNEYGTEHIRKLNNLNFKKLEGEFVPQEVMTDAVKKLEIKTLNKYF